MKFGPVPVEDAAGAILAHSVALPQGRLRKGRVLTAADCTSLIAAGIGEVTVARLDPEDMGEDAAAARIGAALAAPHLTITAPFTGRVNLHADVPGVLTVDARAVNALNAISPDITLATVPDMARVSPRQLLATVKIIPYAVPEGRVAAALATLGTSPLWLHPVARRSVCLILTVLPGLKPALIDKGEDAVRARLRGLGIHDVSVVRVPHEVVALAQAIHAATADMVLILTASATSDAHDTGPEALRQAGGRLTRFGMPVDPGNLLFLGHVGARPVIGLPGCARSPALNGADWVLERIACGLDVTDADIAAMGVGGLLKEIPTRPQARGAPVPSGRPHVTALILAAGASSRMGPGRDKLLEEVAGEPLLARMITQARASGADALRVMLPAAPGPRADITAKAGAQGLPVADAEEGMAASIRAGLAAIPRDTDAILLILADMPEVTGAAMARLIAAFDPVEGRDIIRATTQDGRPGHPVLFGRRFFEALSRLTGDRGARDVLRDAQDYIVDVPLAGQAAITDLDTPEDWAAWRAAKS